MSLYTQEDRDSLYAATDYLQTSSEIDFDFDDVVVNSAAYRRVLAAAKLPITSVAQYDDSEGLGDIPLDFPSFQLMLSGTFVRALYDFDMKHPNSLTFRAGDTFHVSSLRRDSDSGWLHGFLDGAEGWFPGTYCESIPSPSDLELEAYTDSSSVATIAERPLSEEEEARKEEVRLALVKLYMEKKEVYARAEAESLALENLYMETTTEYVQIFQELQSLKCQQSAEYAARRLELDRLQQEHKRHRELARQTREDSERQRKECEQRIQELS